MNWDPATMVRTACFGVFCAFGIVATMASQSNAECVVAEENAVRRAECDLLIVGGTESGWAAAIQAARGGVDKIIIVHDGVWLGGQFTEQALACVDENKGVGKVGWGVAWHPMKRAFHRSGLFRELMDRIETHNAEKYGDAMPGRPYHGPSTFRPVEAERIFRELLQPHIDSGQVQLFWNRYPVRADVDRQSEHPRLTGLWFADARLARTSVEQPAANLHVTARITIDASDWGEAVVASGAAYECGPDFFDDYGEPSAPRNRNDNPANEMNPITWAMIVEETDGDATIERPPHFDDRCFVRTSRLSLAEMSNLPWDRPVRLGSIPHWPDAGKESPRQLSVFTVRRLVDANISRERRTLILLNYMLGQDYPLERLPLRVVQALEATEPGGSKKNIVNMTRRQRAIVFEDAKNHAKSLLHHLQTFVHQRASDQANSFRRFQLSEEFPTPDRLPPKPYIRESLRLKAMYMMREQDGRNRDGATKASARERFSKVLYPDGVFCWQFHYDFHRTGRAYLRSEGESGPWIDYEKPGRHTHHVSDRSVFPLRSLVPIEMDGLLGAQKNLGYSSIVCAAIRLHDQCIAAGQAAGAAAVVAMRNDVHARRLPYRRSLLSQVRDELCGDGPGQPLLLWPYRDLPANHKAFVAINRLSAMRVLPYQSLEIDFRPDAKAELEWMRSAVDGAKRQIAEPNLAAAALAGLLANTNDAVTRGEFARRLWAAIESQPLREFPRVDPEDADGDGLADDDDPLPFTKAPPLEFSIDSPGPQEDGLPDAPENALRQFNFGGAKTLRVDGFQLDHGAVFNSSRGYGWDQDLAQNHRRRGVYPELLRDTFVFTRSKAVWECELPAGRWKVTICVGDAGYEQRGQRIQVEGTPVIEDVTTPAGRFREASETVDVRDGRLTVRLGPQRPACNTCLNWIRIEPAR